MNRLMVVEDEIYVREGIIQKIDWSGLSSRLVCQAEHGLEALQQLEEANPHLLITDIRMPGMDGLELIREAKSRMPELVCVVISGYGEFEYAREAMRYGVLDYVLKPVDGDELNRVLRQRLADITERERRSLHQHAVEQGFEQAKEEMRNLALTRMTGGELWPSDHAIREWWPQFQPDWPIRVAVMAIEPYSLPHYSFGVNDEGLLWYGVRNIVEECLEQNGCRVMVFHHAYRSREAVICWQADSPEAVIREWLLSALQALRKYLKLEAAAGIGLAACRQDDFVSAYASASEAARAHVIHGTGKVYAYPSDDILRVGSVLMPDDESVRYLYRMLELKNREAVHKWLDQTIRALTRQPASGYMHLDYLLIELNSLLIRYGLQHDLDTSGMNVDRWLLGRYETWSNGLDEAVRLIQKVADEMMALASRGQDKGGEWVVHEVKRYIDRFYSRNITLSWIADTFFIHANYFSRLFKELCGISFSDYLTEVRMEHAKRLLQDPSIPIQQIGYLIGYETPSYFSSVFRKRCGVSPSQFREDRKLEIRELHGRS
ncbi:response regulator [Paenibacillaceae bacterium WGS1546]|uniref:response regulator n=1 Tax=Cohnella sp. WGS1546 TaxID=3366810 RepID=UPI00372D3ED5